MNRIIKNLVKALPAQETEILKAWEDEKAKGVTSVQAAKTVADKFSFVETSEEYVANILKVYETRRGKYIATVKGGKIVVGQVPDDTEPITLKRAKVKETTKRSVLSDISTNRFEIVGDIEEMDMEEILQNTSMGITGEEYELMMVEVQRIAGWGDPSEWITPNEVHLRIDTKTRNGEWVSMFVREWERMIGLLDPEEREELAEIEDNEEIVQYLNDAIAADWKRGQNGMEVLVSGRIKQSEYVRNGETRQSLQLSLTPASVFENLEALQEKAQAAGENTVELPITKRSKTFPTIEEIFGDSDCMSKFDFAVRLKENAEKAMQHYLSMGVMYEKDANTLCMIL